MKLTDFDPCILRKAELTANSFLGIHFSKYQKNDPYFRFAYDSTILSILYIALTNRPSINLYKLRKVELAKKARIRMVSNSCFAVFYL